jgi:cell division septation protein DedD
MAAPTGGLGKLAQTFGSRPSGGVQVAGSFDATPDYERALKFGHPNKAKVHYGSATTYLALKRPLDAKREFNSALNIDPSFGQARAQLVMLGDENAQRQTAEVDPILTGSVGAYSGGTEVTKPSAPAAVDVPGELATAFAKTAKKPKIIKVALENKIDDRLPQQSDAPVLALANDGEKTIEEPEVVIKKPAAAMKLAVAPKVESETIEDVVAPQQTGWAVQIASAASEDAAWSTWKKMQTRHKVLQSKNPAVVKADLGKKGTFYRIRLGGFDEQAAAKSACAKLKAGGVNCYISKAGS